MAITVTKGAGATTWTTQLELDLYAGSPEDSTLWQGASYPGDSSLAASFGPINTDRTNVAGMKLMCGVLTVANKGAAAITLQVGGEATSIITFMVGSHGGIDHSTSGVGGGVTGALSDTGSTGVNNTLTLTYRGAASDVTTATTQIWMIVA